MIIINTVIAARIAPLTPEFSQLIYNFGEKSRLFGTLRPHGNAFDKAHLPRCTTSRYLRHKMGIILGIDTNQSRSTLP